MKTLTKADMSAEAYLQTWVDAGYLLHGSPICTETLKPFDPSIKDCIPHKGLCGHSQGVYATMFPAIALWYATLDTRSDEGGFWYGGWENLLFEATAAVIRSRCNGYVYILGRTSFSPDYAFPGDYRSSNMVEPVFVLPVEKDDFPYPIRPVSYESIELRIC